VSAPCTSEACMQHSFHTLYYPSTISTPCSFSRCHLFFNFPNTHSHGITIESPSSLSNISFYHIPYTSTTPASHSRTGTLGKFMLTSLLISHSSASVHSFQLSPGKKVEWTLCYLYSGSLWIPLFSFKQTSVLFPLSLSLLA
jgi:hypothetical protein